MTKKAVVRRTRAKLAAPTNRDNIDRGRDVFDVLKVVNNYTARQVASKAGISQSTVYNWRRPLDEGGTRYPRYHTMQLVLTAYGHRFKVVKSPTN